MSSVVAPRIHVPLRRGIFCLIVALVLTLHCTSVNAETRVALVIGNGDYRNTSKLANPRNDATDVAAALKRIGFTTIVGLDLDKAGMDDAAIRFARATRNADIAIFYYSGHAIQYAATNYLLPVDAQIKDAADLRRLAKVDDLVADLQQAKDLRIMVLDSCRDNPLADELKRALGERSSSVQRGLARLGSQQGMIVAYSTLAGQTADDGSGRNSPYTAAFLRQIETSEEISTVFKRVSAEVYEKTERRQVPELSLSLFQDFYLRGRPEPGAAASLPKQPEFAQEEFAWGIVKSTTDVTLLKEFIARFPSSQRRREAETRLAALAPQAPATAPSPAPPPGKPAPLGLDVAVLDDSLRAQYKIKPSVKGLIITKVDIPSQASEKRLTPGDVIVEVAQQPVANPEQLDPIMAQLKKEGKKSILMLVSNGEGELRFLALNVP